MFFKATKTYKATQGFYHFSRIECHSQPVRLRTKQPPFTQMFPQSSRPRHWNQVVALTPQIKSTKPFEHATPSLFVANQYLPHITSRDDLPHKSKVGICKPKLHRRGTAALASSRLHPENARVRRRPMKSINKKESKECKKEGKGW